MITVLCPSRGRPEALKRSVESLFANAGGEIEVLIAWDLDDRPTEIAVNQLVAQYWSCPIGGLASERKGYARLYEYYNDLAQQASGNWLALQNDDAVMTTENWDEKIMALSPEIMVADLQSNLSPTFCCFPAMRREMYEILGHFSGPTPHVDSYVQDIGRLLGRIAPVDVFVEHNRPDLADVAPDRTYIEGREGLRHEHYFSPEFQAEIRRQADKVRKALDGR